MTKNKDELRVFYLEFNYPNLFGYDNLFNIYINQKKSLPDIKSSYKIDYKNIQFMLSFYKIPIRGHSEGALESMNKREKTNIERYGFKNILSKGTIKYDERNKTVKEKYGVDNVFQIPEIMDRIQNDELYIERYGLTRVELIRKNTLNYFNSLNDEQKKDWHNKMSKSFSNKISKMNKGKITESKIENKVESCFIDIGILYIKQFMILIDQTNACYFYDFYIPSLNMIIEINGDYWHANPSKYQPTYKFRGQTALEKWEKDKNKNNKAIEMGYNIICIWESEIKKLKTEQLINYLIVKIGIYSEINILKEEMILIHQK